MDLFTFVLNIDKQLLLFINGLHFPAGDYLMWKFSERLFWVPFYLLLLGILIKKLKPLNSIVSLVLLILFVDQLAASVIRPLVSRLRPSSPENPISQFLYFVNDYRSGSFGFPSCHAANTFAMSTFLSFLLKSKWLKITLPTWAAVVSFSRIYLGLHYPTDIIAGTFLGIIMGYIFYLVFKFAINLKFLSMFQRSGS